jgi:O-antigen ligase
MFLVGFLSVSFLSKVKLLVAGAVIALIGFSFLPGVLKARYSTMVSDDVVYGDDVTSDIQESARLSSGSRKELLKGGVILTAKNPLFGVGMGNFAAASNERSLLEKRHQDWSVSHNSYVQLSSETGVPGLIFYALAMAFAWLRTGFVIKRANVSTEWGELSRVALCLRLGLVGLFVLMFFGSIAYENYFPCFAGLAVALEWASRQLLIKESAAVPSIQARPLTGLNPRLARRQNQPLPV